jgi:hypothetical protein
MDGHQGSFVRQNRFLFRRYQMSVLNPL